MDLILIFNRISDRVNGDQRSAAEILEGFYFVHTNILGDITFMLENVLNTHFVIRPSGWLLVHQAFES